MKMLFAMLALVIGLSFSLATFVQADEKTAPPAAPAEKKGEMKKDEGKKAEKKEKKKGK